MLPGWKDERGWLNMGDRIPSVSVIVPIYNVSRYLRQCLDGIVMQQTDFRFEAFVHDDASTDRTADIIDNLMI